AAESNFAASFAETKAPYRWPMYDLDGGRQSPFEDEDDYDSCCGPEGHQWQPPSDLVLPSNSSSSNSLSSADGTAADVAAAMSACDQDMSLWQSNDSFIVEGTVHGESMLDLRGFKRRVRPATSHSPASRKPRLTAAVPFLFGR
ncbi:unnamed protein product, partial [Polarella glacialis]